MKKVLDEKDMKKENHGTKFTHVSVLELITTDSFILASPQNVFLANKM